MNILTLVLVIVSIVLAIILIFVVYTIRKYLLTNERKRKYGISAGVGKPRKKPFKTTSSSDDGFHVPIITKPTKPQMPFKRFEYDSWVEDPHTLSNDSTDARKRGNSILNITVSKSDRPESVASLTLTEKGNKLAGELPVSYLSDHKSPNFDKTRRISQGMMKVLATQGSGVSENRDPSVNEQLFIQSISPEFSAFLFPDDNSSGKSGSTVPEIFDSPSVDKCRRRVADRRIRIRNSSDASDTVLVKKTYKKSGKITFQTRYIESEKMVELLIMRAFDLAPKRDVAEINPFVRVYLLPGKRQKKQTKPQKCTKEPLINEKILFTDIDETNVDKYRLKLKVYNHGRLMKNELLGEVDLPLNSIDFSTKETFNLDLFLQRSESCLASVSISICHQATYNKLEVIIQSAKQLPRIPMAGPPNPLAVVQLFKDDGIQRQETAMKRGTRDPVFKESLKFDLNCDAGKPLSSYSLSVSLNHRPVMGKDQILGHVLFCLDGPQKSAANHWRSVHETPHRYIECWHSLLDPDELPY